VLDLRACRKLALEKQPALAAYRASLAAAQARSQALEDIHLPAILRHDLPIRRQQAAQAVLSYQAQVCQAEWDTLYAVTRLYWTVVYAQSQSRLADEVLSSDKNAFRLPYLRDLVAGIGKPAEGGPPTRPDIAPNRFKQLDALIHVAQAQRAEAQLSAERALAALREAVGMCEGILQVTADSLDAPLPAMVLTREKVVALALARRGEMAQAAVGVDVTSLEVQAQGKSHRPNFATFASATDLHVQPVPLTEADGFYRPGTVGIEMPASLVGWRCARVDQAQALSGRAVAVQQKTRQLIVLQAEDAYLRYQLASKQVQEYQQAAKDADEAASEALNLFKRRTSVRDPEGKLLPIVLPLLQEVLQLRMQAVQVKVMENESRFKLLVALAELERVTAGGAGCSGFDGNPASPASPKSSSSLTSPLVPGA